VTISLREDQRLRNFLAAWKDFGKLVVESADYSTYLIRVYDSPVELRCGIDFILILELPPLLPRNAFALFDLLFCLDRRALLGQLGLDRVDLIANVDAVGYGAFMAILAYDVLTKETVGPVIRRRGQADEVSVEILDNLSSQIVN
jgi:hypothetical protein